MPWCPNCKVEYQEGYTECSDCKSKLVDNLMEAVVFEPFFQASDKKIADKLAKFFEYSDLKCEVQYDEANDLYIVAIPPKTEKQAKKLYQAFYYVEAERLAKEAHAENIPVKEDTSQEANEDDQNSNLTEEYSSSELYSDSYDEEEQEEEETSNDDISDYERKGEAVYVMKADQYKDLSSTVWIFLIFGIAGLAFVILNIAEILTFFNGWLPNTVMGILFLLFIYVGLSTNKKAKKVQAEIEAENKLTEEINSWLKTKVTKSFLTKIHDATISEELNFIKMTDIIKEMLMKEFGPQNLAYLDRLIDEYYDSYINE